jgi:hypothetical protein
MKGFTRLVASLAAFFVVAADVAAESGRFVPWSPLTETEAIALKRKFERAGLKDVELKELLENDERHHTYRDADVFAAYPELRGQQKLSECSNSIRSGETELVYLAERKRNEATLVKVHCSRADKGLTCGEPQRGQFYILDGSDRYFSLDGLSFDTAKTILDAYRARRITGLPHWIDPKNLDINTIKSLGDERYEMIFGDVLCSGCFSRFEARLESGDDGAKLVVVGQPDGGCF